MKPLVTIRWAIVERTDERSVDGRSEWLVWSSGIRDASSPLLFRTQREARDYIKGREAWRNNRPDLSAMGWLMPKAQRVRVTIEAIE